MAPVPQSLPHSLYLVLTLPSFDSLTSLPASRWTRHITAAAQSTSSLLVVVRFAQAHTSPWSATPPSQAGGSSSNAGREPEPSRSKTATWELLESFYAQAYGAASKVFLADGRMLATADVVLEEMRGLPICLPSAGSGAEVVKVTVDSEEGTVSAAEEVKESEGADEYDVTALGGTFDHLHAGHKILLSMAASISTRKIIVGVTDEALLKSKKHAEYLESLSTRLESVRRFLELIRPTIEHEVVPISDPFGPTAYDPDIQGLVVSVETRGGGEAINTKRLALSPPLISLEMRVINLVADDAASPTGAVVEVASKMGSTGIRKWLSEQSTSPAAR